MLIHSLRLVENLMNVMWTNVDLTWTQNNICAGAFVKPIYILRRFFLFFILSTISTLIFLASELCFCIKNKESCIPSFFSEKIKIVYVPFENLKYLILIYMSDVDVTLWKFPDHSWES